MALGWTPSGPFSRARAWLAPLAALAVLAGPPGACPVAAAQTRPPAIAAAADLKFALEELAAAFKRQTGQDVRLSFGSSGNFTQQIENGAPFELFLSADESYVRRLAAAGLTRGDGELYAIGRIVLFLPRGSPLRPDPTLADLKVAAGDGRLKRFAIANPEHAPYGRAAREALQAAGAWTSVERFLVRGENAAQAMQFSAGGDAQGGIVPQSLALAPEAAGRGTATLLPESMHAPLRQRMVLMRNAGPVATAFYDYLRTEAARQVLARHGFSPPGGG